MSQFRERYMAELNAAATANDQRAIGIAKLIASNSVQVVQHSLYCVKFPGASQSFPFTDAADAKETGINNFANSRLPVNQMMLVDKIRLVGIELAGVPDKPTSKAANYGSIKGLTALQNGAIDITSDGRIILKDFALSNFITDNKQSIELGTIHLDSPKFIYPDAEFKAEIRTGINTHANLVLKLEFIGVSTLN